MYERFYLTFPISDPEKSYLNLPPAGFVLVRKKGKSQKLPFLVFLVFYLFYVPTGKKSQDPPELILAESLRENRRKSSRVGSP